MTEEQEKRNNRIALISSIGIHAAILLLMFFVIAWRAPDPPNPEYGIVLNYGTDNEGSGDVQPDVPVGSEAKVEETKPEETKQVEEVKEESKPTETKITEEQVTTQKESPVVVKEKKEEEKPVEKPKEKPKEEAKPVEKPKEKVEEKPVAVYKPNTAKADAEKAAADAKEGKPGNQGDDTGKVGDKGDPQGKPDANAMYGKPGGGAGGTGAGLDLYGWDWDNIPKPEIPDNETGRIVFLIEVDEDGSLLGYQKESSSVSVAAERACIAAIQKLTFSKKSGAKVPAISRGKITFVVRSK